ncbi:MAG: murein L,D-transpeptidase family protein [Chthoniobacterales bacterium]
MFSRGAKLSLGIFLLALLPAVAQDPEEMKSIEDRIVEFGSVAFARLAPQFEAAGVCYPPARLTFVALKDERVLEVYAANAQSDFRFICSYPMFAASGVLGPKLREGDRQVPEGVYCIRELNPNSSYHLSLWIDYPSSFDRSQALEDGRVDPGGEIMIHGGEASRGCVAVGDPAAEDLFVLTALTGIENVTVVLAPVDFRKRSLDQMPEGAPQWLGGVYDKIKTELARYPTFTSPTTR